MLRWPKRIPLVLVLVFVCVDGSTVCSAEPYTGSFILPKTANPLDVTVDLVKVAEEGDFEWPAKVAKTNGQWLLIKDDGRSRPDGRPSHGWVRKQDVILTEKDPIENL